MLSFNRLCNQSKKFSRLTDVNLDGMLFSRKRRLLDAIEIQIQRPTKKQRKFYSGKKKHHMMKFEVITSANGKILNISKGYSGRTHDFKIRKMSEHLPREAVVLADSGYQGLQKIHPTTISPHKRRRKCPLSPEQKAHNTALFSKRVTIEHVFAQLKKFKILGSVYRNFRKNSISDSISSPESIICDSHNSNCQNQLASFFSFVNLFRNLSQLSQDA